jgi:hypothetical protein
MASTALAVVHDLDEYRRRRREQAELAARQPQHAVAPMMWCFVWMPVPYGYAMGGPLSTSYC